MTTLNLLPAEQARSIFAAALDADPEDSVEITAELVRSEVSSRGACSRVHTIRRVCSFAAPALALDPARVADVCDELARAGDIVLADRGVLHATPLRAIACGSGTYRIVCSLATTRLGEFLPPGEWARSGVTRTLRLQDDKPLQAAVSAARGVVLTPAAWACLDRLPPADGRWIESLDRRLDAAPEPAGSLDHDQPLAWAGFVALDGNLRWQKESTALQARLWRARDRWGYWRYVWTRLGSPRTAAFVALRGDEGARTVHAVARALAVPATADVARDGVQAVVTLAHWLPVAEYRYLSVLAIAATPARGCSRWVLPTERLTACLDVLRERLGIVVRETGMQ